MTKSKTVTLAALQASMAPAAEANIAKMTDLIRDAARQGAQIILMPELFEGLYFPQQQLEEDFARARELRGHPTIEHFSRLAAELKVVLPVSYFERAGQEFYNSVAVIDASGEVLGNYRKSHIPDGPGYQEKYFFRPGNTGFRAFSTRYGVIGVGICWDQWFPEAARAMALAGADLLFYPTAIGTEPEAPELDTRAPWRRVMLGHAVANAAAVIAANRVGREDAMSFYGCSFISDCRGDVVAEANDVDETVVCAAIDIEEMRRYRAGFGFFRDRRPDLYHSLSEDTSS